MTEFVKENKEAEVGSIVFVLGYCTSPDTLPAWSIASIQFSYNNVWFCFLRCLTTPTTKTSPTSLRRRMPRVMMYV